MSKRKIFSPAKGLMISGGAYLGEVRRGEKDVEKLTEAIFPRKGKSVLPAYEAFGRLIGQIELMACCVYGCPGNSPEAHTLQYLCGRACSLGKAVLRLIEMAYYDEALSLVRSLAEIANLMGLFFWDQSSLAEWKKSDRKYRREQFSPVRVRERYKEFCHVLPMDNDRYRIFCELSTHPVPEMSPQEFNPFGRVMTGGLFMQVDGFVVSLHEVVAILATVAIYGAALLNVPKEALEKIMGDAQKGFDSTTGLSVINVREALKSQKAAIPTLIDEIMEERRIARKERSETAKPETEAERAVAG